MDTFLLLFICLATSYIAGEAFAKVGLPKVVSPILVGLLLGLPFISFLVFPAGSGVSLEEKTQFYKIVDTFKEIAVIFMLFFIGLKIDLSEFKKTSKKSLSISLSGLIVTFLFAFLLTIVVLQSGVAATLMDVLTEGIKEEVSPILTAFVVGILLSISAEEISITILENLKLIKTKIGETIIEAGIIDDVIGLVIMSVVFTFFLPESASTGFNVIVNIYFVITVYFMSAYFIPKVMKYVEKKGSNVDLFYVSITITLFLAAVSNILGLESIIGALFAGVLIRQTLLRGSGHDKYNERRITDVIEMVTFGFLAPFFFLWIGLQIDFAVFSRSPLTIVFAFLITSVAIIGKLLGSIIGTKISGGKFREGYVTGWGMNTRGAVVLIISTLMLHEQIISELIFSSIVFMVIVTTIVSPVIFRALAKRHHRLGTPQKPKESNLVAAYH